MQFFLVDWDQYDSSLFQNSFSSNECTIRTSLLEWVISSKLWSPSPPRISGIFRGIPRPRNSNESWMIFRAREKRHLEHQEFQ